MTTLVIVESPTKARTIRNYLPSTFRVEASMGHVRDLPQSASDIPEEIKKDKEKKAWATLGVNVEDGFTPFYIIPRDKQKIVKELKAALKDADELILATDEDREGESISWHLLQVLKPKVPTRRMVFHEITSEAIQDALKNCRQVDDRLVHAQETRRILDRLVGYTLSPLLWKKIAGGLSAGRVQSVAVRLLVKREQERRSFRKGSYWDLKAMLSAPGKGTGKKKTVADLFEAKLVSLGDRKVATGADFDEATGQIAVGRKVILLNQTEAEALQARLQDKPWVVTDLEEKPVTRKPAPPFTTSTLQQEANRKLRLSARDTMRVAQNLYERGFITYMRTDSVHLSQQAIDAARSCVAQKYGTEYLSPKPRQYTTKSKNAQEAHEAIRPAGSQFRTPQETGLSDRELAVYDMIWKRTIASQMADARQTNITLHVAVEEAKFRSSGKRIDFPGFFRAYVEGSDDPEAALDDQEVLLPNLKVGDRPTCKDLSAVGHETQPPARYTEASLVKALESEGIGRPSTYASIIGTIVDRNYAQLQNNTLSPTFTAFAVTNLLENHFPELVDTRFTARMEQTLDDISNGEAEWLPYLENFYNGDQGLSHQVKIREDAIDPTEARTLNLSDLSAKVRIGRYGAYVEMEAEEGAVKASLPKDLTPADLSNEQIDRLLKEKTEGPDELGIHPETAEPIYLRQGPYGPYVQLGEEEEGSKKKPKRASLPKGVTPEQVTIDYAVGLLSLPRLLGTHPETSGKIQASLGRFGPYVMHSLSSTDKEFRSLKKEDNVLTITLDRALALLAEPKASKGRSARSAKPPLRELGQHPVDQEPVNVYQGPYGVYVKHGKVNASLPEGETPETLTLDQAVALLNAKSGAKGKSTGKTTSKTTGTTIAKTTTQKRSTTKAKTSTAKATDDPSANGAASVAKTAKTTGKTASKTTPKTTTSSKTNPGKTTAKKTAS